MSSWLPWIFLAWEFLSRFALEHLGGERKSRRYDKAQAPVPGSLESQYLSIFQPLAAGSWCRMIYQPSSYSPQALTPWPVKTQSDATAMRPLAEIGGSFDNLIKDGGKTKSAKSQLIKMHLCAVNMNMSVMDAI